MEAHITDGERFDTNDCLIKSWGSGMGVWGFAQRRLEQRGECQAFADDALSLDQSQTTWPELTLLPY